MNNGLVFVVVVEEEVETLNPCLFVFIGHSCSTSSRNGSTAIQ